MITVSGEDPAERFDFSQPLMEMMDNDESLLPLIVFSDETVSAVSQLNRTLTLRFWSETNPHMAADAR